MNGRDAPVWFGGGKLAADLTLPKLRQRWRSTGPASTTRTRPGAQLTAEERRRIWSGASSTAARTTHTIRSCAFTDPAAAADAAWAASDALHVTVDVLGSRMLRRAADSYASAARCGYGRIPRPTAAGNRLRATARLLALVATVGDEDQAMVVMLVAKLAELAFAVAELREVQRHAAQASAARAAAERLHAETCPGPSRGRPPTRDPRCVRIAGREPPPTLLGSTSRTVRSRYGRHLAAARGKKRLSRQRRVATANREVHAGPVRSCPVSLNLVRAARNQHCVSLNLVRDHGLRS